MFKKYLTLTLAVLVFNLALGATAFGTSTNEEKDAKRAEKVKANITKLGTGKDARVEVTLKDGTKIKGYVSQINEAGFVVVNENAASSEIPYPKVKGVKGRNLSSGAKIGIIVGVTVAAIVVIGLVFAHSD